MAQVSSSLVACRKPRVVSVTGCRLRRSQGHLNNEESKHVIELKITMTYLDYRKIDLQ